MARKRIHALYPLIRAPDGSAFIKCELCGVSVPVALADMHDCWKFNVKRRRNTEDKWCGIQEKPDEKRLLTIEKKSMVNLPAGSKDQPRSPFCFFMEEFSKNCEGAILIEVYERGFEAWKNLSLKERFHYLRLAETVDEAYREKINREEIDNIGKWFGDEASSPSISFCQHYEDSSDFGSYSSY